MPGRPCLICASSEKTKIAADMIAAGATDQAVADRVGGVSRPAVRRHRINHVTRPAQALVEASNKGMAVRAEREQLVAAAEGGDTAAAYIGLNAIVSDLRRVGERLERTAAEAEAGGQRLAVAALAGQQHKSAEVRAKLGQVGSYAPPKAIPVNAPMFSIVMQFSDRVETIEAVAPAPGAPVIDLMPDTAPTEDDADDIEDV